MKHALAVQPASLAGLVVLLGAVAMVDCGDRLSATNSQRQATSNEILSHQLSNELPSAPTVANNLRSGHHQQQQRAPQQKHTNISHSHHPEATGRSSDPSPRHLNDKTPTAADRWSPLWPAAAIGERDGDTRIPFWNIAHMVNSIEEIEPALNAGANGIEVDISFSNAGVPVDTFHGFPCDCGRHCYQRDSFNEFMRHVGGLVSPPHINRLLVMLLDLKLKDLGEAQKRNAGTLLARGLHENIYAVYASATRQHNWRHPLGIQPPVRVIISINHVNDKALIGAFIEYMREHRLDLMSQHVGFDVGMNDDLSRISSMWDEFGGQTLNIWQGDGLTNCANIIRGVERLKEAITVRNNQGHFRKIYYWTADVMYQIRSVLRLGLDAILTNQPQRVVQVLNEPEIAAKYRLATAFDEPFAQFWIKPSAWKMSPPTLDEAAEFVENIRETSANYVRTLPSGIMAAIEKAQKTLTNL